LFSVGVVLALALSGCGGGSSSGPIIHGSLGVGETCHNLADCRNGLSCDSVTHTCQPAGSTIPDAACVLSAECMPGYYCTQGPQVGKCEPVGTGAVGADCSGDGQCGAGLMCVGQGLTGVCSHPGMGDLSAGCTQATDCMAGLLCLAGICTKAALLQPWSGAGCDAQEAATPTVLFHVPRASDPPGNDFYQLPFPNDIRRPNGKINLTGHPTPGARLLAFDLVARYIAAIEQDSTGFGVNEAIFFRFSRMPDMGSFAVQATTPLSQQSLALLNITPSSPEYGVISGVHYNIYGDRTPYICDRYLSMRPPFGHPLRPGTTYAAIVRRIATDESGTVFGPDSDFSAMLADGAPADSDLAAAWAAYAPLRDYIADDTAPTKLTAGELAAVAVFTTERIEDPMTAIQAAIAAAPAPALSPLVRCNDPGAVSPCDDGQTGALHKRGCFPDQLVGASFDEYQGTISLPVFQQGTPPYLDPNDGGGIILGADGTASIVRNENVCISLAVPHGKAPAAGWPLVVYSHGTGGSYRSAVELGLAQDYATGLDSAGPAVATATLGYDGILHGTRNGNSTVDVGELVYNFLNPRAARDNALQAAADLLAIPRALGGFAGQGIKIDSAHVALYGHSQGGNAASLALAFQAGYGAGVMSGTGGTLIYTILQKSQPVDMATTLPLVLGENAVGSYDQVLNLMQMYFERSDSVNFGRHLFLEPYQGVSRRHALHVYGTNDSYAPVETQRLYAEAAGFPVATPLVDDYPANYGMITIDPPVIDNQAFGTLAPVTAAQIQYQPAADSNGKLGYDGHFVSTQNPSARTAIQKFLVTFMRDDAPTIEP
jgi:predicted esterase